MARRGRRAIKPAWIISGLALLLVAIVGSQFFISSKVEPYRKTESLNVKDYLDNANSLRGNVYKIQGEVVNALAWSAQSGRLIAVKVDKGEVLPVLVTTDFNSENIQKGQRFIFLLEIDEKGILRTKDLSKA